MSWLLHTGKTASQITSGKVGGPVPTSTRWWAPQLLLHGMGLIQAGSLLLRWLGDTSLSNPAFSLLWHYPAIPPVLQGLGPHLSCSTAANMGAPDHPQQPGATPNTVSQPQLCLDSAGAGQGKKGWVSVVLFASPLANIFFILRWTLVLLMMSLFWVNQITLSDFLPLKNEAFNYIQL